MRQHDCHRVLRPLLGQQRLEARLSHVQGQVDARLLGRALDVLKRELALVVVEVAGQLRSGVRAEEVGVGVRVKSGRGGVVRKGSPGVAGEGERLRTYESFEELGPAAELGPASSFMWRPRRPLFMIFE